MWKTFSIPRLIIIPKRLIGLSLSMPAKRMDVFRLYRPLVIGLNFQRRFLKSKETAYNLSLYRCRKIKKAVWICYLTVSAMKLFFQNSSIDTLILASGDRDYIPLISELKASGKSVIILAVPETLSKDLTSIVDGVISYESKSVGRVGDASIESADRHEFQEDVIGTVRECEERSPNDRWVNLAAIGLALKKKDSNFTHTKYGYRKLADMLHAIPQLELKYDNYEKTVALTRTRTGEAVKERR